MRNFGPRSNFDIIGPLLNFISTEDREKIKAETKEIVARGPVILKVNFHAKIEEALSLSAIPEYGPEDITHFGNNRLAEKFFWYRLNHDEGRL